MVRGQRVKFVPSRYMQAVQAPSTPSQLRDSSRHQNDRREKSTLVKGKSNSSNSQSSSQLKRQIYSDATNSQSAPDEPHCIESDVDTNSQSAMDEPDFIESDVDSIDNHGHLETVVESPGPQNSRIQVPSAVKAKLLHSSASLQHYRSAASDEFHSTHRTGKKQSTWQTGSPLHVSQSGKARMVNDSKATNVAFGTHLPSGPQSSHTRSSHSSSRKGKALQTVAQSAPSSPRTSFPPSTFGNNQPFDQRSENGDNHSLPTIHIRTPKARGQGMVASSAPQSPAYSSRTEFSSHGNRLSMVARGHFLDRPLEMKLMKDMTEEDRETLKDVLSNRLLQWRYVIAKKKEAMAAQEHSAQRQIYQAMAIVKKKREEVRALEHRKHELELQSRARGFVEAHGKRLEAWSSLETEYKPALKETVEAISNIALCIPLSHGAKAEVEKLLPALNEANKALIEVQQPIQEFATILKPTAELMSNVGNTVMEVENLLEEFGEEMADLCDRELQVVSLCADVVQSSQKDESL